MARVPNFLEIECPNCDHVFGYYVPTKHKTAKHKTTRTRSRSTKRTTKRKTSRIRSRS